MSEVLHRLQILNNANERWHNATRVEFSTCREEFLLALSWFQERGIPLVDYVDPGNPIGFYMLANNTDAFRK